MQSELYRFGDYELRPAEGRLQLADKDVDVQQKVLALIVYLIRNGDRNVSKDELQDAIWPETVVTEAALTRAVMKARKALGESADDAQWIKTVHGFGYRFDGPVNASLPAAQPAPAAPRRWQNLLRSFAAYGAFAWLLNQGAAVVWEAFEWSRTGQQWLLMISLLGFLPVGIYAWLFAAPGFITDALAAPPNESATPVAEESRPQWLSASTMLMLLVALCISLFMNYRSATPTPDTALEPNRIAVLPFKSDDPSTGAGTAAGITETLRHALSGQDGLIVTASSSSRRYADESLPAQEVASRLRAALLVEGRVQSQGGTLRVTSTLISGATGKRLWSEQMQRPSAELFALEDQIGGALLTAVQSELGMAAPVPAARRGERLRGTENLEAYQLFREATLAQRQDSKDSLLAAREGHRQAIALDPHYAKAWAGLAQCELTLAMWGVSTRAQGMVAARQAAENATAYDDQLALPYMVNAEIMARYEWQFASAEQELNKAIALAPNDTDLLASQATLLSRLGHHDRAARTAERAWAADPLNASVAATLTTRLLRNREAEAAAKALSGLLAINPEHGDRHWLLAQLELLRGDPDAARRAIAKDELAHLRLSLTSIASFQLGETATADAALNELIDTDGDGAAFQIAEVYAQRGDVPQTIKWLEHAWTLRDPGIGELLSSPMFEPIYSDSRFAQFAERMQLEPQRTSSLSSSSRSRTGPDSSGNSPVIGV